MKRRKKRKKYRPKTVKPPGNLFNFLGGLTGALAFVSFVLTAGGDNEFAPLWSLAQTFFLFVTIILFIATVLFFKIQKTREKDYKIFLNLKTGYWK